MANIDLITFDSSTVTPQHDALMADAELTGNGLLYGCTVSKSNDTELSIAHGVGVIYGREFEINAHTITIQRSESGTQNGQLFIRMELGNPTTPISIKPEVTPGSLTPMVDNPNCNTNNNLTEIQLCTFTVDGSGIVNDSVVNTLPVITPVADAIATIQSDLADTNSDLTDLSGKTVIHQVTSATANLNGAAYRDNQRVYYFTTATAISNGPSGVVDGWLIVLPTTQSTKQIFLRYGTVGANDSEIYVRTFKKSTTTWSPWSRLSVYSRSQDIQIDLQTGWSKSWGGKGVYYIEKTSGFTEIASVSIAWIEHAPKLVVPYFDKNTNKVGVLCESNSGFDKDSKAIIRVIGR